MKNRGLLVFSVSLLAIVLFSINAYGIAWCPGGVCDARDPPGSSCNPADTKQCTGSLTYGTGTGCQIGVSTCQSDGTWGSCIGWQASGYENPEASCDNIDNDCDGLVNEGNICNEVGSQCFDGTDNDLNSKTDCQDDKCLYTLIPQLRIAKWWVAPSNISGQATVNATLDLGKYSIQFSPITGHNYTTIDSSTTGNCCEREFVAGQGYVCLANTEYEVYIVKDVTANTEVVSKIKGLCGSGTIPRGIITSTWEWDKAGFGQTDCSELNCVNYGGAWQDINAECSYLVQEFRDSQVINYIGLPANQAATWAFGNIVYIGTENFLISCIQIAGSTDCGGSIGSFDRVVVDSFPAINYSRGRLVGTLQSCTYGNQLSCQESATTSTSSTTSTIIGGSSTTTTVTGGGFGVCGDGVVNTGEQCEKPGDCIPLGMNDCDMSGLITGFECRCYSALGSGGIETILSTTSCQDVGNGQQGLRTETTKVIDVATGNVLSETSQQIVCTVPPVNVPGFSLVNILLVSSILLIYYAYKKK